MLSKRGMVIGFVANVNHGLGGLSGRNLNRSLRLLTVNTGFVGTPQMVFTNPIRTIHVHKTIDWPSMSSIPIGGYKSIDVENPKGKHLKASIIV